MLIWLSVNWALRPPKSLPAARRLLTLSILTAGILPPTLVTGFFGMNTRDLPFLETPGGTWYALALAAGAGALTYWAIQRMRAL